MTDSGDRSFRNVPMAEEILVLEGGRPKTGVFGAPPQGSAIYKRPKVFNPVFFFFCKARSKTLEVLSESLGRVQATRLEGK